MDLSGQYHCRSQMNGLPMNSRFTGSLVPYQGPHPMFSFDGLPRSKPDGQFMNTWSSNSILSSNFIPSAMPITQTPAEWAAQSQPLTTDFDDQSVNDCYGYSTLQNNATDGSFPRSMNYADVPRTWPSPYEPRMAYNDSVPPKTYKASSYMITPQQQPAQTSSASTPGLAYDAQESSRDFSRLSISQSPRMEDDTSPAVASFDGLPGFVMPSRESSSDSGSTSGDLTVADVEDHGAVEPYAKLIYRALMSKPDHSMVLQEIYQWFRDNTAKGSSDTKGWMNSIRHNLSMNAAFKKTERKVSGDESRKSTEWVLEEFAIKDGVQSTTRYRKGTGNKKFTKSDNPAPSRQSSGRKGGICASKTKFSRQRARDDRSDLRCPIQRLDTGHPYQYASHPQMSQRQVSPIIPCPEIMPSSSPYFIPKTEHFDLPHEDMCGLGDVQAVYVDDSPLFSNGHDSPVSPFHSPHPISASQRY